mgnify:CR=1 FL=1
MSALGVHGCPDLKWWKGLFTKLCAGEVGVSLPAPLIPSECVFCQFSVNSFIQKRKKKQDNVEINLRAGIEYTMS